MFSNTDWAPAVEKTLPVTCLTRIKKNMTSIYTEPPPGICVEHDEKDISLIYALITGPEGTPYEGGFFYFLMRCPDNYPINPPTVKFMTTGGGTVKFGPNLYPNGKVCISTTNKKGSYSWSAAHTIASVFVSIQSLLNNHPYGNKRGYESEINSDASADYNMAVQHETIRVAVCGMLENETHITIPETIRKEMRKQFLKNYDFYENIVKKNTHVDGQPLPGSGPHVVYSGGKFKYAELLQRLQVLREKCKAEMEEEENNPPEPKVSKLQTTGDDDEDTLFDADFLTDDESD